MRAPGSPSRPRFQVHFTPTYGSCHNLIERWFAALTTTWAFRQS